MTETARTTRARSTMWKERPGEDLFSTAERPVQAGCREPSTCQDDPHRQVLVIARRLELLSRPRFWSIVLKVGRPGVSVIIPARNEGLNLPRILDSLPESIDEVIVIDGNSTDETVAVAEAHDRTSSVFVQRSKGKGAALSLGLRVATHEYVVMIDADGSMDVDEISSFVAALDAGADVVRGSRYLPSGGSEDLTAFRSFGNKLLTGLANTLFEVKWTDLAYGYAAFRRSALEQMDVFYYDSKVGGLPFSRGMSYGQGFEIESLIFCRSARRGLTVVEIPSIEASRWNGASNLKAIPDGFRALSAILIERARSRRIRLED